MIVGIIAIFAILFSGGTNEAFFIDKMEKGVKEYVIEKDRKNEILSELKSSKKTIKAFDKNRKKQLKTLKKFYKLQATSYKLQMMKI